jgi:formylglycine-generating enzyme required for sulfatase activity
VEANVLVNSTATEDGNFRYGLPVRRSGDDQYYAFAVSPRAETWHVLKHSPDGLETLVEGSTDTLRGIAPPGFTPDQTDMLRVDAKGESLIFHINAKAVAQISDADYASGEVGFFVETFEETLAHIHYDALTIREVEFDETIAAALAPTDTPVPPTPTPAAEEASPTSPPAETPASASDALPATEPESPTPTPSPEPAATSTNTPAPPPTSSAGATVPEGMVLIPAGSFLMGSSDGQPNEAPEHQVSLDAFYIDLFEVTNAQYRQCVNAGGCTSTGTADSFTRNGYRDDPTYDNYPVISVTWDQANAYCRWAGKQLPTEAEWEYAASGPDNLIWPWGNSFDPNLSAASAPDTQQAGNYPNGVSPFGVFDMAGNVAEWVADTFDPSFYANSPASNPVNTAGGDARVYRGGSFANPDGAFYIASRRYESTRSFNEVDVGFRCTMDAS